MLDEASRFFIVLLVGAGGQLLDGTLGMGFGVFSASVLLAAGFSPVTVVATVNAYCSGSRRGSIRRVSSVFSTSGGISFLDGCSAECYGGPHSMEISVFDHHLSWILFG